MNNNIFEFTENDLKDWLIQQNYKSYYGKEIIRWLYFYKKNSPQAMTNLPITLRHQLEKSFNWSSLKIIQTQKSDNAIKVLQQLSDGHTIEAVLMKNSDHYTVCLSTQVGCAMGCKYCLTAQMGLKRHLTCGEIVEQIINLYSLIQPHEKIRNIVYMGMGEPFHNYQNVIKSLNIFLNSNGLNFSNRHITISTVGLIPGIKSFYQENNVKANLAISLNAVSQEERLLLMPIAKKYPLDDLIAICRKYPNSYHDPLTFEYVLIHNVNDSLKHAKQLIKLIHGCRAKINLIPYNENSYIPFQSSLPEQIKNFQTYLLQHGMIATLRKSKGRKISAACGQLGHKYL